MCRGWDLARVFFFSGENRPNLPCPAPRREKKLEDSGKRRREAWVVSAMWDGGGEM